MSSKKKLKNNLKRMLYIYGKSIKEFAQEIEVSDAYFSRILNGKALPSIELTVRISKKLGIDPKELRKQLMDVWIESSLQ